MSHHWLLITFTCFGPVSLQYLSSQALGPETEVDLADTSMAYPLSYTHYFNQPINLEPYPTDVQSEYVQDEEVPRRRRTVSEKDTRTWQPNLVDTDKTIYLNNEEKTPIVVAHDDDDNNTEVEKKNFSPWGGKRDVKPHATFEHMWSWKRSSGIREPSMPKRVRFSPWGGKRSGQMIYKPGYKGSKIIFSSSIPELTRIVSNYSPGKRLDLASFHFIPGMDKRHPIKILALSTSMNERTLRDALPFNSYTDVDSSPKVFKPGHPYNDVQLKKDGKRKMKFSIWGGKRSPPIIGPIWTPASEDIQDSTLNTILLLRNKIKDEATNTL